MSPLVALRATDLRRSFGHHTVLDGLDFIASPGQRVGLIGENGSGKSTLLRLLAGLDQPDAGTVVAPADLAYLAQEPPFEDDQTVGEVLRLALAPLHHAVAEIERLGSLIHRDPDAAVAFADVLEWAQHHDAWDADRRAAVASERLGVGDLPPQRKVAAISGGERTRLAMAALVTRRPECILLDEPTNHLDDAATELIESFLLDVPGVVVVASPDRTLLDSVCTHLVDLDPAPHLHRSTDRTDVTRFTGSYSQYLGHRADARRRWEQTYADQQERIADLRAATRIGTSTIAHNRGPTDNDKYIYGFKRANVERTHARRVHDAERRLRTAEREQVRKPPQSLSLRAVLAAPATAGAPVIQVRDLTVRGRVRVPVLDVPAQGRLLVTGANGSGKSSLIAVLAGRLEPDAGVVHVGANKVGVLEQDATFAEPALSARATYAALVGAEVGERHPLEQTGLLHARDLAKPVASLSIGQRRRLALAMLVAIPPDLLLLDEPTNHISLALATELEEAFGQASGTIVVASHDRWLRRRWRDATLALSRI